MKRSPVFVLILFFSFVTQSFVFADSSISSEILEKVKVSGKLENVFLGKKDVELSLVPNSELSIYFLNNWTSEETPRLTTEKLFYLDKKNVAENLNIEKISRILRSISTMKGSEYYSNRHKKWEVLYHDAYLVDSPESKIKIPDDTEGSADGKIFYCMQDDNSFGKCYYTLSYHQTEKEVCVCFDNFEPLKFGPITAAKAHNIKINLLVSEKEDFYLVYLMVQAYYPKISLFENMMLDSFNARVESIYNWFVREASK